MSLRWLLMNVLMNEGNGIHNRRAISPRQSGSQACNASCGLEIVVTSSRTFSGIGLRAGFSTPSSCPEIPEMP